MRSGCECVLGNDTDVVLNHTLAQVEPTLVSLGVLLVLLHVKDVGVAQGWAVI